MYKIRLLIIGNGFDLAHNLKTSYDNFIDDFWKKELISANNALEDSCYGIFGYNSPDKLFQAIFPEDENGRPLPFSSVKDLRKNSIIHNVFLDRLERERETYYWSGIEELYYRGVQECEKRYSDDVRNGMDPFIKRWNNDFNVIKTMMEQYLGSLSIPNEFSPEILNAITKNSEGISKFIFVNFNYTSTPELYRQALLNRGQSADVLYIHGKLHDKVNPVIFGYGDEVARENTDIVESKENEFLRYTKSVLYFSKEQYTKLLTELNSNFYEVYIMGHSCTNGDRTLLRTIFRGDNCHKIKYFHYSGHYGNSGMEDYQEKVCNIYRIFDFEKDDPVKSKLSLDPYDSDDKLPQLYTYESLILNLGSVAPDTIDLNDGFIFVPVPKGSFKYGVDGHEHSVEPFYMGKYPVTYKQFVSVIGESMKLRDIVNGMIGNSCIQVDRLPVSSVSWYDAITFCNCLSERYGLTKYYNINGDDTTVNGSATGFRLPTEVQWEYAAGYSVENRNKWAGCDNIAELRKYAWFWEKTRSDSSQSKGTIHPVGLKLPNELGLYDLCGNVWEWCFDKYLSDDTSKCSHPSKDEMEKKRVARGGSFRNNEDYCLVTKRRDRNPEDCRENLGFRIVLPSGFWK